MSLLNRMLQELDARRATSLERANLSPHVRALPAAKSGGTKGVLLAIGIGGALAGGVLVAWLMSFFGGEQRAPSAPAVPAVAAPATMVAAAPAVATPAPVKPVVATSKSASETSLKMDTALPARSVAAPKAKDAKPPLPSAVVAVAPPSPSPAVASPAPSAPTPLPASDKPGQIDKQPRQPKVAETIDAEYRKALAAIRRGAASEGAEGMRHVLQQEPRHASARQALLSVLVDGQQWPEAQTVASDGLALDPAQPGWAMLLARMAVERGEMGHAVEILNQYAPHAERSAEYQAFHALLLLKSSKPKEAAARYQAAVALRPAEGRWWYALGTALEADQRPKEAREAFLRARESGNLPADLVPLVEQRLR
ncbi:MAG TPA: tetratricopeptide repeat protein [Rhodocyclaceae bacterium]